MRATRSMPRESSLPTRLGICVTHVVSMGEQVMGFQCQERQLNESPAYLTPGFAFWGSRRPKDLHALLYKTKECEQDRRG